MQALERRDVACLSERQTKRRDGHERDLSPPTVQLEAGLGLDDLDRGSEIQGGARLGG